LAGQVDEAEWLAANDFSKHTGVWRPTQTDVDSAAFKVIVGPEKFTASGERVGTIFDVTEGGFREFKSGSGVLDSSYQTRLQTYFSLKPPPPFKGPQPFTIETARPVNPAFGAWFDRWGVAVVPPK
jgi:hypothetical protein